MKPITHYRQLTFRYLRQQRKRSILTAIGIVLSVALMFASGIMGETIKGQALQSVKERQGNFHVAYKGIDGKQLEQLKSNAKVEEVGVWVDAGHMAGPRDMQLNVVGADDGYRSIRALKLAEGRLPQAPGEIALERWYADNDPAKPKIGDRIKLKLELSEEQPGGETKPVETEAVLTGFYVNRTDTQLSGQAIATMTLEGAAALRQADSASYNAAIRFDKHVGIRKAIPETTQAIGAGSEQAIPNIALLTALGESDDRSNNTAINVVQGIVIGVILIATVAVIYNSFHISVLERIRQFGVLRSIGMTPRQIRVVVFREATVLALIAIPLGLLCGWLAVKTVLAVFASIDNTATFTSLHMTVPWTITALAVALGFCAVYASAFGPAWAAGRVSPLTAIMRSNQFNKEKIIRRKRRLTQALLGITGKMAVDNLKRNRRRFRITLFSMSIGIALFVFFFSFMKFIQLSESRSFSKDFAVEQARSDQQPQITPQEFETIAELPGVKKAYRVMLRSLYVQAPADKMTKALIKKVWDGSPKGDSFGIPAELLGYRKEDFSLSRDRLIAGSMDAEEMDRETGVVISQKSRATGDNLQMTNYKVGDMIPISLQWNDPANKPQIVQVKVLGILDKMPVSYHGGSEQYTIVTTEAVFRKLTGSADAYSRIDLAVDRDADYGAIKDQLQLVADRLEPGYVMDFTSSTDSMLMVGILLYGLVAVISLISAINIVNTISTNLILRTKEFGTMRAVGMTMRQMRRMIVYESISYGIYATLYGGAAGALLSYWMYQQINSLQELPYRFPWFAVSVSGAAAVIITMLASRVPLRRIERMDVVQAIRSEE
ncbi:ABC transporter permease [Paenibacillus cymbidii]|uniref:ABC transporter permease n=1 Tax=Paenibacillus cymbidii TaxID=1639034 RepID=UPI001080AAE5|nr:ABC transporter permease [Paenibacillus cymbidii]